MRAVKPGMSVVVPLFLETVYKTIWAETKRQNRTRDLRAYTPYNTYRIDGLPPTPIALPGRDSVHAALHPADGDALFFVARGDGSHKFSRTLAEHQKAVREFQLNRREDYRSFPAPDAGPGNGGEN